MEEKDLKVKASTKMEGATEEINKSQEKYNLNDDRRVKVLTPGALVRKRFFRNKVAVVGLVILLFMFVFSFIGGLISPFMGEKLRGEKDYRIIAVEPASCPSFTRGKFAYDFCDTGMVCPLAKMYTLGSNFIPSANHAGGLRYHGMSPILSQLYADGYMEAVSVEQTSVFEAAEKFARVEGILPAPESSHAIRVAIDEALKCKETGEEKTIVFGLTGTGYFDMVAYEKYNNGEMSDYIPTDEELQKSFDTLPKLG